MRFSHLLLALLVALVWGVNFIFVRLGLDEMSPLLLCALRFIMSSVPAIFFIKPPAGLPFRMIATYGFIMFGLQFALLFIGMNVGMTPGMASLLMQVQVFFSIFFAAAVLGERPNLIQIMGAFVAFTGIGLVAMHFDNSVSLLGFIFIMAAAATWGFGNLITKKMQCTNMIALIVWASFVACFPMAILSILIEGVDSWVYTYDHISGQGIGALMYIAYISTWVGYGAWNWLINRYPVSTVVPFNLLVPVVGIVSSILIFGEEFQLWKLAAGLLVISGLCINLLGLRFSSIKLQTETA